MFLELCKGKDFCPENYKSIRDSKFVRHGEVDDYIVVEAMNQAACRASKEEFRDERRVIPVQINGMHFSKPIVKDQKYYFETTPRQRGDMYEVEVSLRNSGSEVIVSGKILVAAMQ